MSGIVSGGILRGFAGKVPARGDFVHAGLPRDFADPWHDWQSSVIAGSRAIMGETWLEAFLEAPVWRFVLPAGLCGKRAAIGLIMPSVDKVGRYFPLTFAALPNAGMPDVGTPGLGAPDLGAPDLGTPDLGAPGLGTPDLVISDLGDPGRAPGSGAPSMPAPWIGWLDAAEALGRAALDEDATPERLMPPECPEVQAVFGGPPTSSNTTSSGAASSTMSFWWTDGGPRVEATRLSLPTLPDAARFASMLGHLAPTESAS